MRTTSFFIVRHGESTWNAMRRWQGRADPPLSEFGEAQARSAGASLDVLGPIDAVITSTLQRARRTGELVADGRSIPLAAPLDDLSERSAGVWEGLTRSEIEDRFPGYLAAGNRPRGYEDEVSVVNRSVAAIAALAEEHAGRRLLVVSHGGVIRALERHANSRDTGWQRVDNLEGRWFAYEGGTLATCGERIHLLDSASESPSGENYA